MSRLEPALARPAPKARAARAAAPRLLYVEDNEVNALLMQAVVGLRPRLGMELAWDAAAGLAAALRAPPDLLLIDLNLPDEDGFTLLARMRAQPVLAPVPAVLVTASVERNLDERARACGFDGCWTKPLDVERVLASLDRWFAADSGSALR